MALLSSPRVVVAAAATLLLGGLVLSSPTVAAGGPLAAGLWWHWSKAAGRRAASKAARADVVDLVDRLIQHLKTGGSLRRALRDSGGDRIVVALTPPALGSSAVEVTPRPTPELRLFMSTMAVLVERGGPALPSLERLSDTLRSSQALQAENEMQAGQATASSAALVALPGLFIAGLAVADERLRRFYFLEAGGAACLLGAGLLSYFGWWLMQRLIWIDQ